MFKRHSLSSFISITILTLVATVTPDISSAFTPATPKERVKPPTPPIPPRPPSPPVVTKKYRTCPIKFRRQGSQEAWQTLTGVYVESTSESDAQTKTIAHAKEFVNNAQIDYEFIGFGDGSKQLCKELI